MNTSVSLTIFSIGCIMLFRNNLIYKIRIRRLGEIRAFMDKRIDHADFINLLERAYKEFDAVGYHSMVFDITRWTYKQFYPKELE